MKWRIYWWVMNLLHESSILLNLILTVVPFTMMLYDYGRKRGVYLVMLRLTKLISDHTRRRGKTSFRYRIRRQWSYWIVQGRMHLGILAFFFRPQYLTTHFTEKAHVISHTNISRSASIYLVWLLFLNQMDSVTIFRHYNHGVCLLHRVLFNGAKSWIGFLLEVGLWNLQGYRASQ